MTVPQFPVALDPRVAMMTAGFDSEGQPLAITPASLETISTAWPTTMHTPAGISEILGVSRRLFAHSCYVYEFLPISAHYALMAIEAALKERLGGKGNFVKLINQACEAGLLNEGQRERLHAGRELRNGFSHPSHLSVWTLGMTEPILRVSHEVVADVFPAPVDGSPR